MRESGLWVDGCRNTKNTDINSTINWKIKYVRVLFSVLILTAFLLLLLLHHLLLLEMLLRQHRRFYGRVSAILRGTATGRVMVANFVKGDRAVFHNKTWWWAEL